MILVINPGSTSTKISVYDGKEEIFAEKIVHLPEDLANFTDIIGQLDWRQQLVLDTLKKAEIDLSQLDCIVARGGVGLDPLTGGTYLIDEKMVNDLYQGKNGEHASNLAGIIAHKLSRKADIPALTVDPVSVDEFESLARLSGLPELPRRSQSHALNLKAVARKTAFKLNRRLEEVNLIGVHLGGGISICSLKRGRIIDVNNANQGGPYSPERTGSLPVMDLIKYIYREKPDFNRLKKQIIGRGGLMAYLGNNDGQKIEERIRNGDRKAELVYQGMIYQIAKEIGAMATVLLGEVDAIFITGGLAVSQYVIGELEKRVSFIAPLFIFPGSEEMANLAAAGLRFLTGEEKILSYEEGKANLQ